MVKSELIKKLCDLYPNILHRDIEKVVTTVFNEITEAVKNEKRYELRNFGAFKAKTRKNREAKNPKTGEKVFVKEKKVLSFKMSKLMKKKLKN